MSRRNSSRACGARTRACRVHTRVNAWSPLRICTRPRILLHPCSQPRLYRVSLNIFRNPVPLHLISHPMIVGLALPKLFARSTQQPVCVTGRNAFQRFQQQARRYQWQQEQMNVIRHDRPRSELIMPQTLATKQGLDDDCRDPVLPQVHGTGLRCVEVTIHPGEGFAAGNFSGGREMGSWQASEQMPGEEQPAIIRIDVGKAASGSHALSSGWGARQFSCSHECEHGTHECVRHISGNA